MVRAPLDRHRSLSPPPRQLRRRPERSEELRGERPTAMSAMSGHRRPRTRPVQVLPAGVGRVARRARHPCCSAPDAPRATRPRARGGSAREARPRAHHRRGASRARARGGSYPGGRNRRVGEGLALEVALLRLLRPRDARARATASRGRRERLGAGVQFERPARALVGPSPGFAVRSVKPYPFGTVSRRSPSQGPSKALPRSRSAPRAVGRRWRRGWS